MPCLHKHPLVTFGTIKLPQKNGPLAVVALSSQEEAGLSGFRGTSVWAEDRVAFKHVEP